MGSVELLTVSQVSALVEPGVDWEPLQHDDGRLIEAVVVHDQAIRHLFRQTPVLPLRFGTRFASAASLLSHLETSQVAYLNQLTWLTGKVEYTLKLIPVVEAEPALPEETQGRDYFLAKKQRYQAQATRQAQQAAELQQLQGAIAQTYPDSAFGETRDGDKQAYLLMEPQAETLLQQVLVWQSQYSLWQMSLGEPLPPYHFV